MRRLLARRSAQIAVLALLILGGCGGGDGGYDWDYGDAYPQSRYMTLYLRIEDPEGYPLGGSTVEIEDRSLGGVSIYDWYRVGDEGPDPWQGWPYNWGIGDYRAVVYDPDDQVHLNVRVSKAGYGSDSATVDIHGSDPPHIYVRIRFVLGVGASQVAASQAGGAAPQATPAQAEKAGIALAQPEYQRPTSGPAATRPVAKTAPATGVPLTEKPDLSFPSGRGEANTPGERSEAPHGAKLRTGAAG